MAKRKPRFKPSPELTALNESELEQKFYNLLLRHHAPEFVQQHKFHPTRNWRFDFCWPEVKVAVEIQGFGSGHNSFDGMKSDYEKHNEAMLLGWNILYFMAVDLDPYNQGQTIATTRTLLNKAAK